MWINNNQLILSECATILIFGPFDVQVPAAAQALPAQAPPAQDPPAQAPPAQAPPALAANQAMRMMEEAEALLLQEIQNVHEIIEEARAAVAAIGERVIRH
jgi:hypothetical protein